MGGKKCCRKECSILNVMALQLSHDQDIKSPFPVTSINICYINIFADNRFMC